MLFSSTAEGRRRWRVASGWTWWSRGWSWPNALEDDAALQLVGTRHFTVLEHTSDLRLENASVAQELGSPERPGAG